MLLFVISTWHQRRTSGKILLDTLGISNAVTVFDCCAKASDALGRLAGLLNATNVVTAT